MQSHGIALAFHREVADSSRELVGPDIVAAAILKRYPRFIKGGFHDYKGVGIKRSTASSKHRCPLGLRYQMINASHGQTRDDWPDGPLNEQGRGRDHESSDEGGQTRKQHDVAQHTSPSPLLSEPSVRKIMAVAVARIAPRFVAPRFVLISAASNDQCEQLNRADSYHQHCDCYGVVIEPMPPLAIHDAPPCSSVHICPTLIVSLPISAFRAARQVQQDVEAKESQGRRTGL
jgi:hypothetical protein